MTRQFPKSKLPTAILGGCVCLTSSSLFAGASCVVAKKMGNSLAIEWRAEEQLSARAAMDKAKSALRRRGFKEIFPQASSENPHGFGVIVTTSYKTYTGRMRNSYGCGFSSNSYAHAEADAAKDLRAFSWGWKPEYGYKVAEKFRY